MISARAVLVILSSAGLTTLGRGCGDPVDERKAGRDLRVVRIVSGRDHHHFDPAEVRLAPGQSVRFVLSGSYPQTIAFDTSGAKPASVAFLRRAQLLSGPLLTDRGQLYDVSFRGAPPGTYSFFSGPRAAARIRGSVIVSQPTLR